MFKHTGNFPYTCEYCGKGFAGRSQYRYHALRHNGHSPYICKECGGRFWKKRNMEVNCDRHRNDDAPAGLQKCAVSFLFFEPHNLPGDSRSWESSEKTDNVWLLFTQILLR